MFLGFEGFELRCGQTRRLHSLKKQRFDQLVSCSRRFVTYVIVEDVVSCDQRTEQSLSRRFRGSQKRRPAVVGHSLTNNAIYVIRICQR